MSGHHAAKITEFLKFIQSDACTIPDECAHCDGAIMMRLTDWNPRGFWRAGSWVCPYCQRANEGEFAGRIDWVRKSTGNEEPIVG
jgi:hypothetical protein